MTYFSTLGITSSDIGGAIAEAIIHDIRINGLGLQGFPQVNVLRSDIDCFGIQIQFNEFKQNFTLTNNEAQRAVGKMKINKGYDSEVFERVQQALANLEGYCSPVN